MDGRRDLLFLNMSRDRLLSHGTRDVDSGRVDIVDNTLLVRVSMSCLVLCSTPSVSSLFLTCSSCGLGSEEVEEEEKRWLVGALLAESFDLESDCAG